MSEFGFAALGWLVAIAAVLAGLAAYLIRFRPTWRAAALQAAPPSEPRMGRLSVLESAGIEGGRQLLLVRCDDIEHLIMVGGPADLVVENDVRRNRTAPVAQPLGPRPAVVPAPERTVAVEHRESEPARAVSEAKAPEPRRAERPAEARERPAATSRPVLAAVPAPHAPVEARQSQAPAAPLRAASPAAQPAAPAKTGATGETPRRLEPAVAQRQAAAIKPAELSEARAKAKSAASEAPFGRREAPSAPVAPPRREPVAAPSIAAVPVRHEEPARVPPVALREPAPEDRQKKPNGSAAGNGHDARRPGLPTAEVPWPETDTIENEIVRAFRGDRPAQPAADKPAQAEAVPAKPATDPATTLGDLAERLEEALAREVQLANKGRGTLDLDLDAFAFDAPSTPAAALVDVKPQPASQAPVKAELKAVFRAAAKPHQTVEPQAKAVKPPNAEKPAAAAAPTASAPSSKTKQHPIAAPEAPAPKVEAKAAPMPPNGGAALAAPQPVAQRKPEIVQITAPAETVQAAPAPQPAAPEPQARPELTAAPDAKVEAELAIAPEPLVSTEPIAAPPPAAAPEPAAAPPAALAPAPAGAPPPAALAVPEPQARPELSAQEPADSDGRPLAPAPQAEPRREGRAAAAERQEEAPVISLTARRRDISDPLEDEMARLLGELSGDTRR